MSTFSKHQVKTYDFALYPLFLNLFFYVYKIQANLMLQKNLKYKKVNNVTYSFVGGNNDFMMVNK